MTDSPGNGSAADLIARLRAGDEKAFKELVTQYEPAARRVALSLTGSLDSADDVVQSVFVSFWQRRENLVIEGDLKSYIIAAVYKCVHADWRSGYRASQRNAEWGAAQLESSAMPGSSTAASERQDLLMDIDRALNDLPERTAAIFKLLWVEQLSYADVARITGISVKGVERARERALKHLAHALRAYRAG